MKSILLLIEDELAVRQFMRDSLKDIAETTLLEAASGQRALSLVADTWPDLILLDLTLPDLDGWTVWASLKRQANSRPLNVVLYGAAITDADEQRALTGGARVVLHKPLRAQRLQQTVRRLLNNQANSGGCTEYL